MILEMICAMSRQLCLHTTIVPPKGFIHPRLKPWRSVYDHVEIAEDDDIVYAKRINRDNYTKFVKNRNPPATSYFTVLLYKDGEDSYELVSAWVGRTCPSFPDDINATSDSKPFWDKHALVYGTQAIQDDTLTQISPW